MGYPRAIYYAAAFALVPQPALAQKVISNIRTGDDVAAICSDPASFPQTRCIDYITGFLNGFYAGLHRGADICLPASLAIGDYAKVVVGYIAADPTRAKLDSTFATEKALRAAFPCPRK